MQIELIKGGEKLGKTIRNVIRYVRAYNFDNQTYAITQDPVVTAAEVTDYPGRTYRDVLIRLNTDYTNIVVNWWNPKTNSWQTTPLLDGLIGGGLAPDPDADLYFTNIANNGGTISDPTKTLITQFVTSLKQFTLWPKINRLNVFSGNDLLACLVPLKVGGGSALDVNIGPFINSNYTLNTGLTGNGTSRYLNTNLNPGAVLTQNDTHFAIYSRAANAANSGIQGSQSSAAQNFVFTTPNSSGLFVSEQYNTTNGAGHLEVGISPPYGFLIASRLSLTNHAIYQNGILRASNAGSGGTIGGWSIFIFALNNSGTAYGINVGPYAAYSVGSGLTATDVSNYTTIMKALQDGMGRSVI